MKATDLLAELRPPLDDTPDDPATLDRILLARPEPTPSAVYRYRRPLVAVGVTAMLATGAVALAPSSDSGPVGIARAAAELAQPGVLLHFKVHTTYEGGATTSAETWQTPDGRLWREIGRGGETAYDQAGGTLELYVPARNEILVDTRASSPETFADRPDPFGTVADGSTSQVGDLTALLRRALDGSDPDVTHLGRTTVRGLDVDHIQVQHRDLVTDLPTSGPRPTSKEWRDAPVKTITIVRDIYIRHDDGLPVRVVQQPGYDPGFTADYDAVEKLTLDPSTRPRLQLADHPGARRTIRSAFDDSAARGANRGD